MHPEIPMETPPRRNSRTNAVHEALKGAIRQGTYAVGVQLPSETSLAEEFGVSRPVIREAISRLSAEGLVRAERGRGTFVSERRSVNQLLFSPIANIDDLLMWQELRIAIEQEAARLAAERHGSEELARIREAYRRMVEAAKSGERVIDLDLRFHLVIAEATQNRALIEAQASLGDHIQSWMATMLETTRRPRSEQDELREREHLAIVEAIERRDPDMAAQAARRHIENGRTRFLVELSSSRGSGTSMTGSNGQQPRRT